MDQHRHQRHLLLGAALVVSLVLSACAPAPPPRQLVPANHRGGTSAAQVGVAYGPADEHRLDVFLTSSRVRRGTIVFVHGGGFTRGTRTELTDGNFGLVLAQLDRGFDIVSVSYRLAPAHPFPAALHDVGLAISWVRTEGAGVGLDTRRVIAMGHSAGGSLAAMVGTSPGLPTEFGPLPRVDRWVAIAAMSNYGGDGLLEDFPGAWGLHSATQRWVASPITTLDRTDPPGYLIHGDRDRFVADWHSIMFAAHARTVGADVRLDHITSGPANCRDHFSPCGADMAPLQTFLG